MRSMRTAAQLARDTPEEETAVARGVGVTAAHAEMRAATLRLLVAHCSGGGGGGSGGDASSEAAAGAEAVAAAAALEAVGGEAWLRTLLEHTDPCVAYIAALLLLTRLSHGAASPQSRTREQYHEALRALVRQAQAQSDERLLQNPYFTLQGVLHTVDNKIEC
jgi:hypothetical protein